MRIDIVKHLSNFGMDDDFLQNVIFNDDVDQPNSLVEVESVALVDFNQLTKELEPLLNKKVHYIVDHHVDSNMYLETLKQKDLKLIGSACTLVCQKLLELSPDTIDSDLAMFLSAPISLDSYNFSEHFYNSKWVDDDKLVFDALCDKNDELK